MVLVQHNSSGFDKGFVQWLDTYTKLDVKLAEEGDSAQPGKIYVAKTDLHLTMRGLSFAYNNDAPENNQKPAVDALFRSAAETLGESVISVVLTGMGSDGAEGTRKIREKGGITLAQDEASSLIYGMPKAAAETGCVDLVLPLDKIPQELVSLVRGT
jgi:two-component system chemotaxis response regulator CheB